MVENKGLIDLLSTSKTVLAHAISWLEQCPEAHAVATDIWHIQCLLAEADLWLAEPNPTHPNALKQSSFPQALVQVRDNILEADWTAAGWTLSTLENQERTKLSAAFIELATAFIRLRAH